MRIGENDSLQLLAVDAPCHRDITEGISSLDSKKKSYEQRKVYQKVQAAKERDDFVIPREEKEWQISTDLIAGIETQRQAMQHFLDENDHLLGRVFAASGLRTLPSSSKASERSIRDWALVQLTPKRSAGKNVVSIYHAI